MWGCHNVVVLIAKSLLLWLANAVKMTSNSKFEMTKTQRS